MQRGEFNMTSLVHHSIMKPVVTSSLYNCEVSLSAIRLCIALG